MPTTEVIDAGRFLSHVDATLDTTDLFSGLYEPGVEERATVAELRRRRRRVANSPDSPMKAVSLVEENGVLFWRDGIAGSNAASRSRRRRARRRGEPASSASLVLVREFPVLKPNKIGAAIAAIDQRLNPAIKAELRSRLRPLRFVNNQFVLEEPEDADVKGPFAGRTLLFVHGTFSSATNMLGEFKLPGPTREFLGRALQGDAKYDRILFFDHPTLAVSPIINALELGRALAGSTGQIDVIAHSRGGLVVRWWLEAFGHALGLAPETRVCAVLVGSPLRGTSLAAPDKVKNAFSLISNIGTFAEKTLSLAGAANPFLWVAGKLVEVVVSVTGALANTPLIDALVSIAPGLSGQSAVTNNYEINRLRLGPAAVSPAYHAIVSNFETADPGWQFWKYFRKTEIADAASSIIFEKENDLVVDTASMVDFGVEGLTLAGKHDFGNRDDVWHCSYFRQAATIDYLKETFKV
jgi:pimeloyl-ACP methyl ester carboxylesterase